MSGMPSRLSVVVTLDGEVRDPAQPLLFADDLAAVRGDGVFETLLVRDGRRLPGRGAPAAADAFGEADGPARAGSARLAHRHRHRRRRSGRRQARTRARCGWSTAGAGRAARRRPAYRHRQPAARPGGGRPRDGVSPRCSLDRGLPATGADAMPWLLAGAKTLSYAVNMAALRHAGRQGRRRRRSSSAPTGSSSKGRARRS